jgi:O-methyltransferase involved in polyketide biosynthesis
LWLGVVPYLTRKAIYSTLRFIAGVPASEIVFDYCEPPETFAPERRALDARVAGAGGRIRDRATIIQEKTGRPVQFELTEQTRAAIQEWLPKIDARKRMYLFRSRFRAQPHLSTRQYARIVHAWVASRDGQLRLWHALDASDEGRPDL